MKLLAVVLACLLALIQYPLWVGHGSWLRVWDLDRQLGLQQEVNAGKRMRNEGLEAEAADLRSGTLAIEERARYELGMVGRDEIFVQFNPAAGPGARALPGAANAADEAGGPRRLSPASPGSAPPPVSTPGLVRPPGGSGPGAGYQGVKAPAGLPPAPGSVLPVGR